jgi:hypothetical protein
MSGQTRTLPILAALIVAFGLIATGVTACGTPRSEAAFDSALAETSVRGSLPKGWSLAETRPKEIPFGHYWGDWSGPYKGQPGTLMVVSGTAPVFLLWTDEANQTHRDPVGVEALDIWLMPPGYRNNWRTLLSFHAPEQPERIFADQRVRVYARPSAWQTITDQEFKDRFLAKATYLGSPESPWNDPDRLSWRTWRDDLRRALRNTGQK